MRPVGFSTGAVAKGDFRRALDLLQRAGVRVVELSALRLDELSGLVSALSTIDLSSFAAVSFHAPSAFAPDIEPLIVSRLSSVAERGIPIVVHPDVVRRPELWRGLGNLLLLENMDKRKPTGRYANEMQRQFDLMPDAGFCFDIAHAHQIDPTMVEAVGLLKTFGRRLAQVHISELDSRSRHRLLAHHAVQAYRPVAHLIPDSTPIIIESLIDDDPSQIAAQISWTRQCLLPIDDLNRSASDVDHASAEDRAWDPITAQLDSAPR